MARESARASIVLLLSLALAKLLIQFAGINHYGFFRDELYYIACGEHLAWGYIDQPPLIALIAWFARHTFGDVAVRRPPSACAGRRCCVFSSRVGSRANSAAACFAQFLAALAMLLAPAYLAFDSFLSMNAFEPLFWVLCAWIAIRIVKGAVSAAVACFWRDRRPRSGKQTHHARFRFRARGRAFDFRARALVRFEMDLDWRSHRASRCFFQISSGKRATAGRKF